MPEMFCRDQPRASRREGIANLDWVVGVDASEPDRCKALVTRSHSPFRHNGQGIHEIGLPYHWGIKGLVTGRDANDLVACPRNPNLYIQEDKR